jgi:polar amino acid transport system substrate-binding protein
LSSLASNLTLESFSFGLAVVNMKNSWLPGACHRALNAIPARLVVAGLALVLSACAVVDAPQRGAVAATAPTPLSISPAQRQLLAPSGKLRVGVYLGSPTSLVRDASGQSRGVSVDMGGALAQSLGLPFELVEFPRLALVLDALKSGQVDMTVTNATPARAADMNFTEPLVLLELGYLVLPGSRVQSLADVDRSGVRIGVSQGSTSQGTLSRQFRNATVVGAPSLQAAAAMLKAGQIDAFATNKGILHDMADGLTGAQVLPGRWGLEQLALAIPKGREAALSAVQQFVAQAKAAGLVQRAAERAGLRGTATAP